MTEPVLDEHDFFELCLDASETSLEEVLVSIEVSAPLLRVCFDPL